MEYDFSVYAIALSKVFAYKCAEGRRIIELVGDPKEVFRMKRSHLEGLLPYSSDLVGQILDPATLAWAEEELEWNVRYGIRPLYYEDKDYPSRLRECYDSPLVLFSKGLDCLNPKRALAVVGTRRASWYGKSQCVNIVKSLAAIPKPPLIVSGLAFGIDAAAHTAALEAGLQTIAVIPTGLDSIYPPQHRELALRIAAQGALVTDFPRSSYPQTAHFIRRNRIIAGMSDATLLAESFAKGGGLITTDLANSYDREVFAVPGRLSDASSEGCNSLIEKNLAHLARGAHSICRQMGWGEHSPAARARQCEIAFPEGSDSRLVIGILKEESPRDFEEIMAISGLPFNSLSALLLEMEMNGTVISTQGRKYALKP